MKGFIKKLLGEGLVNENDSKGIVDFLKNNSTPIKSDATEDTTFSSGVEPIESTDLDIFDTRSYISSYNKFVETDSGYPLLVGFVQNYNSSYNFATLKVPFNPS